MSQRLQKGSNASDAAAKNVIAHRQVLAQILKGCVDEFKDVPIQVIQKECIERISKSKDPVTPPESIIGEDNVDKSTKEGTVKYDIRFTASVPGEEEKILLTINIEVQGDYRPEDKAGGRYELVTRGIYYCARLLSRQKGTVFSGSSYQHIRKVYSIWVCLDPDAEHRGTITKYEIGENCIKGHAARRKEDFDKLCLVMICLKGIDDLSELGKDVDDFLSLIFSDMKATNRRKALTDIFGFEPENSLGREMDEMCDYGLYKERQGEKKGLEKGENRMLSLFRKLKESGLSEEMDKAILDPDYARKLIKVYGL